MALTEIEFQERLQTISKLVEDKPEIMSILGEIQEDYTEKASVPESDIRDTDGRPWREKYAEMSTRYRERFFGGGEAAKQEQAEDIRKDDKSTTVTFETLFKGRESDT